MNIHLLLILIFLGGVCRPLRVRAGTDTLVQYLSYQEKPVPREQAVYRRTLVFLDSRWEARDYFLFNERLHSVRHYLDDALTIEDGMFLRYYSDGNPEQSVLWRQNLKEGLMTQWHPDGSKMLETQYRDGKLNGPYRRWHENGRLMAEGNYRDSLMDGDWQWYYERGAIASKEQYERGSLKVIQCFDSSGKTVSCPDSLEEAPVFPGGEEALYKFLSKHVRYPSKATKAGAQGTVMTLFWIEKDGSLSDIQVIGRVHPALDAEAYRVIGSMPRFVPSRTHLVPIRVRFRVPLRFVLQ